MVKCAADHAVFYKRKGDQELIVTTSVDDLTITGDDKITARFRRDI